MPRLVLWHWLGARLALLFACGLALTEPSGLAGSPFHPVTLACAHLFVLGFLVPSMLGAYHVVARSALAMPLRADWRDVTILVSALVVASGVASHMALGTYSGVAWSGALLLTALLLRVPSWWLELKGLRAPLPMRVGIGLSWLALLSTIGLGMALAIDRGAPFLPLGHQQALFGHLHLGLGGFALCLAVSLDRWLLPMLRSSPAVLDAGVVCAVALGAFGLAATRTFGPEPGSFAGFCLGFGVLLFLFGRLLSLVLRWLVPVSPTLDRLVQHALPGDKPARLLHLVAMLSLGGTLAIGLLLSQGKSDAPALQLSYGVLAMLGYFGSMVFGFGVRLPPRAPWTDGRSELGSQALSAGDGMAPNEGAPGQPRHTTAVLVLPWITAIGWCCGTALLLVAIATGSAPLVAVSFVALGIAVVADSVTLLAAWRRGPAAT